MPVPLAIAAGAVAGVATLGGVVGLTVWAVRKTAAASRASSSTSTPTRGSTMASPSAQPKPMNAMSLLQPRFRSVLEAVLGDLRAQGFQPKVFETVRSAERQRWLYENTKSTLTPELGKHGEGLAADVIDGRPHPTRPGQIIGWGTWNTRSDATPGDDVAKRMADDFFQAFGRAAVARGLTWGGNWASFKDFPHVELDVDPGVA